jgi:hypothetical protein
MRTRHRAAALAVAALALVGATACQPTPDQDAFYQPPRPLPAGTPGAVIRSRPSTFTLDPIARTPVPGVRSWQVLYRSQDAKGAAIATSGTVLVPTAAWSGAGTRPLVTYAVGTRGLGDPCAPSYTLSQGSDYEGATIAALLARGWAVVVTDYQGLGTPGTHTYTVGPAQGRAVLDAARAAQRLPETGLSRSGPVGIMGYSQGGGAAGWAGQMAGSYAPDLRVAGVAPGGVPGDLIAVADFVDGGAWVALALMAAVGFDTAYPELRLASYLNDRGRDLIARSKALCLASADGASGLVTAAFTHRADYVTRDPLATAVWRDRLGASRLGGTRPAAPVFQYHGLLDELVPYDQAAATRDRWCTRGAEVTFVTLPAAEHVTAMVEGFPLAMEFLAARFAGRPTTSTCSLPV